MLSDEKIIDMARANGVNAMRLSTVIDFAQSVERAAREAAIEECARVAENIRTKTSPDHVYLYGEWIPGKSTDAARAIRALQEGS